MIDNEEVIQSIENKRDQYIQVASQIWDYAETCFQEHRSSRALESLLEQEASESSGMWLVWRLPL